MRTGPNIDLVNKLADQGTPTRSQRNHSIMVPKTTRRATTLGPFSEYTDDAMSNMDTMSQAKQARMRVMQDPSKRSLFRKMSFKMDKDEMADLDDLIEKEQASINDEKKGKVVSHRGKLDMDEIHKMITGRSNHFMK